MISIMYTITIGSKLAISNLYERYCQFRVPFNYDSKDSIMIIHTSKIQQSDLYANDYKNNETCDKGYKTAEL